MNFKGLKNAENRIFIKNLLFQAAWCMLLTQVFLTETKIPLPSVRVTVPCLGLICLSMLICLNYSLKQLVIVGALGITGILTTYISKNSFVLWACVLLACSKDIRYKHTLKYMLAAMTAVFIIAVTLAASGIIENVVVRGTHGEMNKFALGFGAANMTHAYVLTMCLLAAVLFYDKINVLHCIAAILANIILFHWTKCKTSAALIILLFTAIPVIKCLSKNITGKKILQGLMLIGNVGIILSILLLVTLPYFYDENAFWVKLLGHFGTVKARFRLSSIFVSNYKITLFGNYIHELTDHSLYLDIGYEVLLLRYGIIFTLIFCCGSIYLLRYFRKNEMYAQYLAVMLILIHTCMENLYIIAFYNFTYFWLAENCLWRGKTAYSKNNSDRKKFFLRLNKIKTNNAGFKAVKDCEQILLNNGFEPYDIYIRVFSSRILNILVNLGAHLKLELIPENSDLVIAHPLYDIGFNYIKLLETEKKQKNIRLIFLIHDLLSLRENTEKSFKTTDKEMTGAADIIIAHNSSMKKYLTTEYNIPENRVVILGLFDYLCEVNANKPEPKEKSEDIIIAGNLNPSKAGYLNKLGSLKKLHFQLYGGNYSDIGCDNMNYHGSFSPEELPCMLKGAFGLVWDGDSEKTCSGNCGEYLRYNDPHKTSLYFAAGIPVITWREAAIADIIEENHAGITVEDLGEITERISEISDEEYSGLCSNAERLGDRIRAGQNLEEVIKNIYGRE